VGQKEKTNSVLAADIAGGLLSLGENFNVEDINRLTIMMLWCHLGLVLLIINILVSVGCYILFQSELQYVAVSIKK